MRGAHRHQVCGRRGGGPLSADAMTGGDGFLAPATVFGGLLCRWCGSAGGADGPGGATGAVGAGGRAGAAGHGAAQDGRFRDSSAHPAETARHIRRCERTGHLPWQLPGRTPDPGPRPRGPVARRCAGTVRAGPRSSSPGRAPERTARILGVTAPTAPVPGGRGPLPPRPRRGCGPAVCGPGGAQRSRVPSYISSISSPYSRSTTGRFILRLGVSSPCSMSRSRGSTRNFLTVCQRWSPALSCST